MRRPLTCVQLSPCSFGSSAFRPAVAFGPVHFLLNFTLPHSLHPSLVAAAEVRRASLQDYSTDSFLYYAEKGWAAQKDGPLPQWASPNGPMGMIKFYALQVRNRATRCTDGLSTQQSRASFLLASLCWLALLPVCSDPYSPLRPSLFCRALTTTRRRHVPVLQVVDKAIALHEPIVEATGLPSVIVGFAMMLAAVMGTTAALMVCAVAVGPTKRKERHPRPQRAAAAAAPAGGSAAVADAPAAGDDKHGKGE